MFECLADENSSAKSKPNAKILQSMNKGPRWVGITKMRGENFVTFSLLKMSVESILMDFQVLGSSDKEIYVR